MLRHAIALTLTIAVLGWPIDQRPRSALQAQSFGFAAAEQGGGLPGPLPLLPPDNWWNQDMSAAPVDHAFGAVHRVHQQRRRRRLHPDFGGYESPGSVEIYGFPYVVVGATQPKRAVTFYYGDESDGVNHATGQSFPFYPIPDEAIAQPHWIEGG